MGKIEEQIRGIGKMVDDEGYCIDIFSQLRAVTAKHHLHTCVATSIKHGYKVKENEKISEIMELLSRFRRID